VSWTIVDTIPVHIHTTQPSAASLIPATLLPACLRTTLAAATLLPACLRTTLTAATLLPASVYLLSTVQSTLLHTLYKDCKTYTDLHKRKRVNLYISVAVVNKGKKGKGQSTCYSATYMVWYSRV